MTGAAQPGSSEIAGEYYLRGVMETASGLRLNADSSFEFFYSYGALDRQGKGKWQLQKNLIILNSSPKPKSDFALIKSEEIKGDSIFVKITDNNNMVLRYVKCDFQIGNQIISANTDAAGRASIPQTKFESLELIFTICPDRPTVFVDLNKNHNYFEFRFEKWICEVVFKDLKLRIDKNGLTGQHPLLAGDSFSYIKNIP
jgi:hypothetical protein